MFVISICYGFVALGIGLVWYLCPFLGVSCCVSLGLIGLHYVLEFNRKRILLKSYSICYPDDTTRLVPLLSLFEGIVLTIPISLNWGYHGLTSPTFGKEQLLLDLLYALGPPAIMIGVMFYAVTAYLPVAVRTSYESPYSEWIRRSKLAKVVRRVFRLQ